MIPVGQFLIVGSVLEGLILLGATVLGLALNREPLWAYAILIPIGVASVAGTVAIGRALLRGGPGPLKPNPAWVGARPPAPTRALWARGVGIASLVLFWPLGIVLGPLTLWLAMSSLKEIQHRGAPLVDGRPARQGAVMGALVCACFLFWAFSEASAIVLFGAAIPAAP